MVVEQTTVSVSVTRLPIRLLKVVHPRGHQLVVGGRLVSETVDGTVTPHPDLPAYGQDRFPVPLEAWSDGLHPDVKVLIRPDHGGELRPIGCVRAGVMLFTARDPQTVRDWIRSQK